MGFNMKVNAFSEYWSDPLISSRSVKLNLIMVIITIYQKDTFICFKDNVLQIAHFYNRILNINNSYINEMNIVMSRRKLTC